MEPKKIKIVHILQSAGGVAEYLKDFLNNINSISYENMVIASNDYREKEEIIHKAEKIFFLEMVREIAVKKDLKAVKEIRKILKKEKPDIVYLHSSKAGALGRIALLFNRKIKIIYNAHGWYFNADIGKKKVLYQIIEKILAYRANKIIAISKSEYDSALEKHITSKNKLILIENGIDIEKYKDYEKYRESMRKQYKIEKDATVVGIVGRISEQKDPLTTIRAAAKIINENRKIYFMFVGNGNLEEKVRQYAKEQKISDNIIITGWVNNVKSYISTFDIALLPSKWEGFGLAILEYMICKKPIITTKVGGIADILNKEDSAFFIQKEEDNKIVNHINYIINHDKDILKLVEKNYQDCCKRFSIQHLVYSHEQVFKELVSEKGEFDEENSL